MFNKKEKLKQHEEEVEQEIKEVEAEINGDTPAEAQEEKDIVMEKDKEIDELKVQVKELQNDYLRKQAEFQNFTKRKQKELEELRKFASEQIITKLLDGLDNLERAVDASKGTKDFDSLIKGVEMILNQLKDIMKNEGVEEINTIGQCDPMYHHPVMVEDSPEHNDNDITMALQKGYTMKGKVIRPAMVKICKKENK